MLQVACHEIQFPWHPEEYAANGQGVIVGPQTPTHMTPGIYYPLIIKPSGKFEADIMVGQELLPGQYEAYFYQKNSPFEKQGLVSKRVSFDVLESDFK